jgi:hypothetical protein
LIIVAFVHHRSSKIEASLGAELDTGSAGDEYEREIYTALGARRSRTSFKHPFGDG